MPAIDPEIAKFVNAIGAVDLASDVELQRVFKRHNYFACEGRYLIVKDSRSKRPFWGVGKDFIDLLDRLDDYYLVLLVPGSEGWVFSKAEVTARIKDQTWKLRAADNNYKINFPLPDRNAFAGPKTFRKKIGLSELYDPIFSEPVCRGGERMKAPESCVGER